MTTENNVIEVKKVIVFDKFTPIQSEPTPVIYAPAKTPATNSAQYSPSQ